jgi:hypothetical protein
MAGIKQKEKMETILNWGGIALVAMFIGAVIGVLTAFPECYCGMLLYLESLVCRRLILLKL